MPDYKEMYLKLFRATEAAISILIEAQQQCEELYVNAGDAEICDITSEEDKSKRGGKDKS